jgi:hypothetical protein
MIRKLAVIAMVASFIAAAALACGSDRDGFVGDDEDGGAASSSSSSSGGGGSSGTPGPIGTGSSSGSSSGDDPDGGAACAAQTVAGEQLPLDIHVMLDISGSMMEGTYADGGGPTKWAQVKAALDGFINDAKSAGLGVGLGVFPVTNANAPSSCTSSAQCKVNGADMGKCTYRACVPAKGTDPLIFCDTSADCPGSVACREFGECLIGGFIGTGIGCLKNDPIYGGCDAISSCVVNTAATCLDEQCVESDYEKARVPIGALPGNAATLTTSIDQLPDPPPNALTPTAGALQGGLTYLKQHKALNPDHVVVLVLATDGFPNRCNTTDIPGIAAIAAGGANGSPSIRTFVIGVFADKDKTVAKTNLDAIADGGATGSAFIVTTGTNVTQQFQQALDAIRAQALPCEYAVPTPEAGAPDYFKVNVQFTSGGQSTVIDYRAGAQVCGAAGGWYYDQDPTNGGTPKKIILCPSSCDAVKTGGPNAKIDVLLGCKTSGVK